jgi:hypothetical protein
MRTYVRAHPSGGASILRTHVPTEHSIPAHAPSAHCALPGPLVPAARGRLRRRLGGRPGRAQPGACAWARRSGQWWTRRARRAGHHRRPARRCRASSPSPSPSPSSRAAPTIRSGACRTAGAGSAGLRMSPQSSSYRPAHAYENGPPAGGPYVENRRRPTLPGPCEPSTIGAEGLNCSVRNGKRCFPLAVATGKRRETEEPSPALQNCTAPQRVSLRPLHWERIKKIRQALDQLVPVSFGRYRPSRSGLSTWWSTRGLTPSRGWESSSRGRLPA